MARGSRIEELHNRVVVDGSTGAEHGDCKRHSVVPVLYLEPAQPTGIKPAHRFCWFYGLSLCVPQFVSDCPHLAFSWDSNGNLK